jgi:hypothetical protein
MALIVEQYVGDRGIQLGREQLLRKFSFGTNWQRIRCGIRCAASGLYTFNSGFNGPIMGISTGSQGDLSVGVTDCIFYSFMGGNTMTFSGVTPNFYYDIGATFTNVCYQRVGSSNSNSAGFTTSRACLSANPYALRTFFAVDITKGAVGAGTYTLNVYCQINTQITTDYTHAAFITAMTTDGTPTNTTNVGNGSAYCGLRTVKDWNNMFVGYRNFSPALTIFDMAVTRYS